MKIRPSRLPNKSDVLIANVGCIVDAWLHDGWCEGIVVHKESDDKIHVYFLGRNWLGTRIVGDARLTGPELVHETTEKIVQIKQRIDKGGGEVSYTLVPLP
ncbi:hypothetical protein Tco_1497266, partial [Tanacetum coccineum]